MALQIRRGTDTERQGVVFALGELVYTTNTQKLYVGDGLTMGGVDIMANMEGAVASVNGQTGPVVLTTDDISDTSANKKYFTDALAIAAIGNDLTRVGATHTDISFIYDGTHISAIVDTGSIAGITAILQDTNPTLGGDLDLNEFDISGAGNIDIVGGVNASGNISTSAGTLSTADLTITGATLTSTVAKPLGDDRSDNMVTVGSATNPNTLWMYSDNNFGVFTGISDGTNNAGITFKISKGTLQAKTTMASGDAVGFIDAQAYDGTGYVNVGAFGLFVDPTPGTVVTTGSAPGAFGVIVVDAAGDTQNMSFTSNGVLSIPTVAVGDGDATNPSIVFSTDNGVDTGFFHPGDGIVCVATNAQESARFTSGGIKSSGFIQVAQVNGTLPTPAAGMIVLDGTTFKGYNGSAWVALN